MKNFIGLLTLVFILSAAAFAQDKMNMDKMQPTAADKTAQIPAGGVLKRGAALAGAKKVSLAKVLANPDKYAGKTVAVEGVIVRSCKMEGCWMELAPDAQSQSVRVNMKDHRFFVPLDSAGARAKAEGTVEIKTLTKAQVDQMIEEDGAKFSDRNADGSVTEVSFTATGVELTKAGK